jgi:hypothetical protein
MVVLLQRFVRKMKERKAVAWKQARKRSATFRWDLAKARFRDAVGADQVDPRTGYGLEMTSKQFNLVRKRRVRSTVFLHDLEEIENMADLSVSRLLLALLLAPRPPRPPPPPTSFPPPPPLSSTLLRANFCVFLHAKIPS